MPDALPVGPEIVGPHSCGHPAAVRL